MELAKSGLCSKKGFSATRETYTYEVFMLNLLRETEKLARKKKKDLLVGRMSLLGKTYYYMSHSFEKASQRYSIAHA